MKYFKYILLALVVSFISGCTDDFDKMNTKPDGFLKEELSAKYFLTGIQVNLFAPNRYPYWRAQLIHGDRFSGQVCFGHNVSWWNDELGYKYHSAYTDAAWDWLAGAVGNINNFLELTRKGGDFENEKMYAVGKIIKGLYFQMYTDIFGMIPYSQAGNASIALPKFDTQKEIYKGVIDELEEAMTIIGDSRTTGVGVNDLADNDVYYKGDLTKWKKLANTLKLRMAVRALGAPDADFAEAEIKEALAGSLLTEAADNCLLEKDVEISQWTSACYGDVWQNFGDAAGWSISRDLIDVLKNNNDPRLSKYAKPAKGGTAKLVLPKEPAVAALHPDRINFLTSILDAAGAVYTKTVKADTTIIKMEENATYVGQPVRVNAETKPYMIFDFFSTPADVIIRKKGKGNSIRAELVMSTAESYFLQAEAAVRGLGSGNAQQLFNEGIKQAMLLWGVAEAEATTYIHNADAAKLQGSTEEKLGKIAMQRWIAAYTDGFEAWAIVRKYGYTRFTALAQGVTDARFYAMGDINGKYPTRMRYGSEAVNTNGANLNAALSIQGADELGTPLWWAKH